MRRPPPWPFGSYNIGALSIAKTDGSSSRPHNRVRSALAYLPKMRLRGRNEALCWVPTIRTSHCLVPTIWYNCWNISTLPQRIFVHREILHYIGRLLESQAACFGPLLAPDSLKFARCSYYSLQNNFLAQQLLPISGRSWINKHFQSFVTILLSSQ